MATAYKGGDSMKESVIPRNPVETASGEAVTAPTGLQLQQRQKRGAQQYKAQVTAKPPTQRAEHTRH